MADHLLHLNMQRCKVGRYEQLLSILGDDTTLFAAMCVCPNLSSEPQKAEYELTSHHFFRRSYSVYYRKSGENRLTDESGVSATITN